MALKEKFDILYVVDIMYYTIIDDSWGIGDGKSKNHDKLITFIVRVRQSLIQLLSGLSQ
jgi:hypothetical protein